MQSLLSAGTIAGGLACASALATAFHYPALGLFLADPATATTATGIVTGIIALAAGVLKGVEARSPKS